MDEYSEVMKCPKCGADIEVKQTSSEFTPCSSCLNCGSVSAMFNYLNGDKTLTVMPNAFVVRGFPTTWTE